MTVYIALLRAINVGGRNRVAMTDLRALASDVGVSEPQTLLQSGNLVFRSDGRRSEDLEALFEAETAKRLNVQTDFLVRTAAEWSAIVENNPFPSEAKADPSHLLVMPLKSSAKLEDVEALQSTIKGSEIVRLGSRHIYLSYPDGIGGSKLTAARIEKALGNTGTARNWNTALKLLEMCDGS